MFITGNIVGDAVQWAPSVAPAGLAAWIFYFYRQDRKDAREKMRVLAERFHHISEEFRGIVERNTEAITKLSVVVEHLNGRK